MLVYPGLAKKPERNTPAGIPGLSGWWRQGDFIASGERASQWSDSSGNARHLLQATGANQPIALPWTGENYAWLPAVSGNYANCPSHARFTPTTSLDLRVKVAADSVTPAATNTLVSRWFGAGSRQWLFQLANTGALSFFSSSDGTASTDNSILSSATVPFAAYQAYWVRVTKDYTTGDINFYTSSDGSSWSQLGTTKAGAIYTPIASTSTVEFGSRSAGGTSLLSGKIYQGTIFVDGSQVGDFNPSSKAESATSWADSYSNTWTINQTGAKQAQIIGRPQIVGDGAAYYMRAAYTQAQPCTRIFLARFPIWTSGRYMVDGVGANSAAMVATTSTPRRSMNAGSSANENAAATLLGWHACAMVWDGASSKLVIDTTTASGGNPGTTTTGGLTILADGAATAANFGSGQFAEIAEWNRIIGDSELSAMLRYINRLGNLGLAI